MFVSPTRPEAAVAQDIEAYGLEMQWAPPRKAKRFAFLESDRLQFLDTPERGVRSFNVHGCRIVGLKHFSPTCVPFH